METNNNNNNAEKQEVKNNETAQAQEQPKQQEQDFEKVEEKTNNEPEPGFFEKAYGVTAEFCKEHKGAIAAVGGAIVSGIIGFFCGKSCSNKD